MPKFLVTYTFRFYGEAQLSRGFYMLPDLVTEADIHELEEAIQKDPEARVPNDSRVQVLWVRELAEDRPKPDKKHHSRKGCAVLLALAVVFVGWFSLVIVM